MEDACGDHYPLFCGAIFHWQITRRNTNGFLGHAPNGAQRQSQHTRLRFWLRRGRASAFRFAPSPTQDPAGSRYASY